MRILPVFMFLLLLTVACGEKQRDYVANVGDKETTPTMTTLEVETFISDSGYTRYHISTPVWQMFEEASEPYWRFPEKLNMQQYDLEMNPDASMICDSAIYFSRKRLWRLDGHVMMVNTLRDTFLSQQLFWDQATRSVYTDSFIHIVRSDRIIEGYGLSSNENMTAYTINQPTAIIPIDRKTGKDVSATDSVSSDSTMNSATPRRRQTAKISSQHVETQPQKQGYKTPDEVRKMKPKHTSIRPIKSK